MFKNILKISLKFFTGSKILEIQVVDSFPTRWNVSNFLKISTVLKIQKFVKYF